MVEIFVMEVIALRVLKERLDSGLLKESNPMQVIHTTGSTSKMN